MQWWLGGYRLLTYDDDGRAVAGVLVGGRVYAAADLLDCADHDTSSLLTLLNDWPATHAVLIQASQTVDPEGGVLLGEVTLRAPILYPRAIFCTGANYWDHIEEMEGKIDRSARPAEPWLFLKTAAHSIIADGAPVPMPPKTKQLDWEAELAVVIGSEARDVDAADAAGVVAGYTILNDLSARDLMTRDDRPASMTYDWVGQKCFDGAAPMGPWLTPAAFVEDCHNLSVRLWVNGALKQDSNTNQTRAQRV